MDEFDIQLRNLTYRSFVDAGKHPEIGDLARLLDVSSDEVLSGWKRLHDAHAVVLEPDGGRLRMLNPFSLVPTRYKVRADGGEWFGNCAWDGFGIGAALGVDSEIETSCLDCGEPIHISVKDQQPDETDLVFHCLIPASRWWDNIVFT